MTEHNSSNTDKLRLRTPKRDVVFIAGEDALFAKSNDHWVKVLVKDGKQYAWYDSHCLMKEFLLYKGAGHLTRYTKFYAVNKPRVTKHSPEERTLVFDSAFPVHLKHPLKKYFL